MRSPPRAVGVTTRVDSGGKPFFVPWIPSGTRGRKVYLPTCRTLEEAKEARRLAVENLAKLPTGKVTLAQGVEVVQRRIEGKRSPAYAAWFRSHAKAVLAYFGPATPLLELTKEVLERFRDDRGARGKDGAKAAAGTVHHRRMVLRLVLGHALRQRWIVRNELEDVRDWPEVRPKRGRTFTPARVAEVLARIRASDDDRAEADADLLLVAFGSGLRRAELARMRIVHLDGDRGTLHVEGKEENVEIELGAAARTALERLILAAKQRTPADYIVPGATPAARESYVANVFRRWGRRLNIPGFRPHAARRTFISAAVASGADVFVVQKLSRHRTLEVVKRYVQDNRSQRPLVDAIGAAMTGQQPPEPAPAAAPAKRNLRKVE